MLKVIYSSSDQGVAQRMIGDLQQAGFEVGTDALAAGDIALLVLSPAALADEALQAQMIHALDLSLHVVPVMTQQVALPPLIDHLDVVDFGEGYDFAVLRKQIELELSPEGPLPMRVLTPTVRRSNRTAGLVISAAALLMFVVGLIAVGVYHIQVPIDEYNNVDTEAAQTIEKVVAPALKIYAQFLPETTEDATNYPVTLAAMPTMYRLMIEGTATAVVRTPTPNPNDGDDFGF